MISEQRKSPRVDFTEGVLAHPVTPSKSGNIFEVNAQAHSFQAVDISREGIRLNAGRPLPPQSILKLNFELLKRKPLDVFARVVWSRGDQAGLKFIVLDENAQKHIHSYTRYPG
jgi:hypothetical protein